MTPTFKFISGDDLHNSIGVFLMKTANPSNKSDVAREARRIKEKIDRLKFRPKELRKFAANGKRTSVVKYRFRVIEIEVELLKNAKFGDVINITSVRLRKQKRGDDLNTPWYDDGGNFLD